ncbi:MAG: hypothetical protein LBE31_10605, partial [Deltaproteobacteria bacterium]|nr:hypothetical protein [Deltaproteobacteria bacterium]
MKFLGPFPGQNTASPRWGLGDMGPLDSLESLGQLFDPPISDPPLGPPPFVRGNSVFKGDISKSFVDQKAYELVKALTNLDSELCKSLVAFGALWLNGKIIFDPKQKLAPGNFRLNLPAYQPQIYYEINPERLVLKDKDMAVYHKESGPPSQGVPHDAFNNVLAAMERATKIIYRLPHRLDAATSGFLILAANRQAASRIGRSFQEGRIIKRYLALCQGPPPDWHTKTTMASIAKENQKYIVNPTGPGLPAKTIFTVIA